MQTQLEEFRDWLKVNTSSENTVKSYYSEMSKLLKFTNNEITNESIQKYLLSLVDGKKSTGTFNQSCKALKMWNKFSKSNFEIPKLKKVDVRLIEDYITEKELEDILSYLPRIFKDAFHVEIVLKFLFYTGLRKSELFNLKRADINLENNTIIIRNTKSDRDEEIKFAKKLVPSIRAYYIKEPEKLNALNVANHNLIYWLETINQNLKFRIHLHAHTFRHSCCTYLFTLTNDLRYVQSQMRHTDVKTTMRYAHLSKDEQYSWYDKHVL